MRVYKWQEASLKDLKDKKKNTKREQCLCVNSFNKQIILIFLNIYNVYACAEVFNLNGRKRSISC